MVLIDYSKRRSDATPRGNNSVTREIPRRHETQRGRGNSVGSYGDHNKASAGNSRSRSVSPLHANIAATTSGTRLSSTSHEPRARVSAPARGLGGGGRVSHFGLGGARSRSGSRSPSRSRSPTRPSAARSTSGSRFLARSRSGGSTNSSGGNSASSRRESQRKLVVPPIRTAADDGPIVDDWINAIVDTTTSSNNALHGGGDDRRISGLSLGSFGSLSGASLNSRSSGLLSTEEDLLSDNDNQDRNNNNKPKKNFPFSINNKKHNHNDSQDKDTKPKNNFPFSINKTKNGVSRGSGSLSLARTNSSNRDDEDLNVDDNQDEDSNHKPTKNFSFSINKNNDTADTPDKHSSNNKSKNPFPFSVNKKNNKRSVTTGDIFNKTQSAGGGGGGGGAGGGGASKTNAFPFLSKTKSSGVSSVGGGKGTGGGNQNDWMSSWLSGGGSQHEKKADASTDGGTTATTNQKNNDWMSAWATVAGGGGGNEIQKKDTSTGGEDKGKKKDWMSLWTAAGAEGGNQNKGTKESAVNKFMAYVDGGSNREGGGSSSRQEEGAENNKRPISRTERQTSSSGSLRDTSTTTSSVSKSGGVVAGGGSNRRISRKDRQTSTGSQMDGSATSQTSVRRRISNNSLQMDGSGSSVGGGGRRSSHRRISRKDRLSIASNSSSHSRQDMSDHSSNSPIPPRKDRNSIIGRSISDDSFADNNMTPSEVSTTPALKDDSLGQSSQEMNESSNRTEMSSSISSFKPLIPTSSRMNRVMRRPGGGGRGAGADEAMPGMMMMKSKAKMPNPFKRCNTSDLVKEHRNRRPTVLVEMDFGDELDMSGSSSSENSDAEFRNSESNQSASHIRRSATAPEQERRTIALHDWSKPSVRTVPLDWSSPSAASKPKVERPQLNRSVSDHGGVHRSSTYPVPLPIAGTDDTSTSKDDSQIPKPSLKHSLSMSNIFIQKPVLEKSISFTIRRRTKEGTNDDKNKILDATNSTFAKLSESLTLNAPNHNLPLTGMADVSGDGTISASLESNLSGPAPLTLQRVTSLSTLGAPKPKLNRSISSGGAELSSAIPMKMLKRSNSGDSTHNIMSHTLKRSVSSGAPTSVMGLKSRRNGMDGSAPSLNGYTGRRGGGGGMDGSAPSFSGYVGRRSVSPASKDSMVDDRSGGSSLSLSPAPARRKLKRTTSAFGFGVPDNKFGYDQRTEEARRGGRGRSPGPRMGTLERATSAAGSLMSTSHELPGLNRMPFGDPKMRPNSASPSNLCMERNPSPSSPTSRPSPGRIRRPSPASRAGSGSPTSQRPALLKKRGSISRLTVLDGATGPEIQSFDSLPKPSGISRYASHSDVDNVGSSQQCKRKSFRRSTSFTQAMNGFNGLKRRPSMANPAEPVQEQPLFKGVRRRPASLSAERKQQSGGRECRSPNRNKSGESLQLIMAGLKGKNGLTPRKKTKPKAGSPSTTNPIKLPLASSEGGDTRSSKGPPLGASAVDRGDVKDLASKRGYGKSNPTEADLGYGDGGSGNDDSLSDIHGRSRTAGNTGRLESRRQHGRSSSMNHCKATYGFHDRSDNGRRYRNTRGSMDQLLTSASSHGQLQDSQADDDLSVASSITSFSSHTSTSKRSRAKGSRQRKNLMSDRRDTSGFVTGSRIRRIEKGKSLGLAK